MLGQKQEKIFETFALEGFSDIRTIKPSIDFYIDMMKRGDGFAFIKRTHGYWDLLVRLMRFDAWYEDEYIAQGKTALKQEAMVKFKEMQEEKTNYKGLWKDPYMDDLISDLQGHDKFNEARFFEAISFRGYNRGGEHLAQVDVPRGAICDSRFPKEDLRQVLFNYCSHQPRWHDALVWKDAVFTGELNSLIEVLKGMEVILVGPPHLATLGEILGLRRFHHISIHPTKAIGDRADILAEVLKSLELQGDVPKVCLFQSGTIAFWFIYRLYEKHSEIFYLDLGRILDIWYPEVVSVQAWFKNNKKQIVKSMKLEEFYL